MRIIFAGTPDFAVPTLDALNQSEHEVVMVLTQADKPAGRGRKLMVSPVKQYAETNNIDVYQPKSLKNDDALQTISAAKPDMIIVIAYGLIVPDSILNLPQLGCICIHLSLLPRWRGAAPGQRAILAGDSISGVTLMQMDSGIDTGDILAHAVINLDKKETTQSLYHRLGELGAQTLMENLPDICHRRITAKPQEEEFMTYAVKIDKQEACINWELSAKQIERMIRAFIPWPVAYTMVKEQRMRILKATVVGELTDAPPGMIIGLNKTGIAVACGAGILAIKQLQWPGGKPLTAAQAINSNKTPLKIGLSLGNDQ